MNEITNVPVSQIQAGNNDRKFFDENKLNELAQSIKAHGLAQPITLRPVNSHYEIVAGERRFRAISTILEWKTIPAIIRDLDDEAASAIMLAENTGRADLNPIEEANAYQARVERFGWTMEKIADIAGVSEDLVKRRISLLKLVPEVQHLVAHGHFPIGHAEAIADLDTNRQRIATRIYRESNNGLPLPAFRDIVNQLLEEQAQDSLFDLENFWIKQVQQSEELPRSGKHAVTGAPTRPDLPEVTLAEHSTGSIIDNYIAELIENGFDEEAAAVGNLYNALIRSNYTRVPIKSRLLAQ